MSDSSPSTTLRGALHQVVGYLNFSGGTSDPKTLAAWNSLYASAVHGKPLSGPPAWLVIRQWLEETTAELAEAAESPSYYDQTFLLIRLLFSDTLPAYIDRHKDLLFHQPPEAIFSGFFLGRVAETLLQAIAEGFQGTDAIVAEAFERLDDYVGYRPVPRLEQAPGSPYPGEYIRPVPLYIAGAGTTDGPYCEIVRRAIDSLMATNPNILRAASFDPARLQELAFDPRAYDFDHPVHRRANYIFGQWDPDRVSKDGHYTRFVVREVTLAALLTRVEEDASDESPADELLEEAAAVLAGTILMGSGISGWGPSAYTSDVTLKSLMEPIASYRDEFYHDRIECLPPRHRERLQKEVRQRRQPFGAARQHLNAALAQLRAKQLQHVQLARLYARMGYPDAAQKQADAVPVTSARLMCRIDCLMSGGLRSLRSGDLTSAAQVPGHVFDMLQRAIDCGACVDPWCILYFSGNFNLFPGPENSIHDHRVDDLVYLVEQLFGYMARVWSEAAARDDAATFAAIDEQFESIAKWWRRFAAHTVESVEAVDPQESYESASLVARALQLWHRGGAAAGDVKFWAPHADLFDSPRAYALVINAMLDRRDFIASMALLIHWLDNAPRIGLRLGGSSLPHLAVRWLVRLRMAAGIHDEEIETGSEQLPAGPPLAADEPPLENAWPLARKFFDCLEANAEHYWSAPTFSLAAKTKKPKRNWDVELAGADANELDVDEESAGGLFDAAYEGVTYHDTTDDGHDAPIFGDGAGIDETEDDLDAESKRLVDHLSFLESLARMWAIAADIGYATGDERPTQDQALHQLRLDRLSALHAWVHRAAINREGLLELLDDIRSYRVSPQGSDNDSMRSYDRRRLTRDSLLERVIGTTVEVSDARRIITGVLIAEQARLASLSQTGQPEDSPTSSKNPSAATPVDARTPEDDPLSLMSADDASAVQMFAALVLGDPVAARQQFSAMLESIRKTSLLYIPLSRGGDPVKIFVARLRQRMLHHLLHRMPRSGLFVEACRLVEAARLMEQHNPIGGGAVTEFDGLFRIGFRSLVSSLVASVRSWSGLSQGERTKYLVGMLESLTETMLASWLSHSQTLRLSSLETVADENQWEQLVAFIRRYGDPIFTQSFLKLSNVRAILHQGVGKWIDRVLESHDEVKDTPLFEDIQSGELDRLEAERWLALVFESILDHHAEFLDYNSTTTQSDRGDLIYMFHDFLRLRVRYDRVAWNLKPVMWAHEILVRSRFEQAAVTWRRSLAERIGAKADVYVAKLRTLQREYAMRMPTIADRILERFVQPMTIDRMRALVEPATLDAEANRESPSFELLQREAELLTRHPTGVGIDMPAWLAALEEEVEMVAKRRGGNDVDVMALVTIPIRTLSRDDLSQQLASARRQGRRLPYSGGPSA
ncbi:MAG: hypothetical protein ACO1RT_14565 [Planctomycetaceae bacterium]